MVKKFEEELKTFLQALGETRFYLGEFDDPEELELCTKSTPMIFIDFQGDNYNDLHSKECQWNLYFIATTANKSEEYRKKSQHELLEFMELVDEKIVSESFADSSPIELVSLKKMFDGITDHGYLNIYVRSLKTTLYMPESKFFN